jgi:hypothetical protein
MKADNETHETEIAAADVKKKVYKNATIRVNYQNTHKNPAEITGKVVSRGHLYHEIETEDGKYYALYEDGTVKSLNGRSRRISSGIGDRTKTTVDLIEQGEDPTEEYAQYEGAIFYDEDDEEIGEVLEVVRHHGEAMFRIDVSEEGFEGVEVFRASEIIRRLEDDREMYSGVARVELVDDVQDDETETETEEIEDDEDDSVDDEDEQAIRAAADELAADLEELGAVESVDVEFYDEIDPIAYVNARPRKAEKYGELKTQQIYETAREHGLEAEFWGGPGYYQTSIRASDLEDEDDETEAEDEPAREAATDGGQSIDIDLRECGRCGEDRHELDFETDPRWGEVCDECHAELISKYDEPDIDLDREIRTDGGQDLEAEDVVEIELEDPNGEESTLEAEVVTRAPSGEPRVVNDAEDGTTYIVDAEAGEVYERNGPGLFRIAECLDQERTCWTDGCEEPALERSSYCSTECHEADGTVFDFDPNAETDAELPTVALGKVEALAEDLERWADDADPEGSPESFGYGKECAYREAAREIRDRLLGETTELPTAGAEDQEGSR